jgi:hypothetical protein
LADFGNVTFTGASATAGGHTGAINDPNWTVQQVTLQPSGTIGSAGVGGPNTPAQLSGLSQSSSAGASASTVSSDGSSFTVTYSPSSEQSSAGSEGQSDGYAYGAYGYSGDGYSGVYIYGY